MYQAKEVSEQRPSRFEASVIPLPTRAVDRYQPRKRAYVSVRTKFIIAIASATAWLMLCVFLAEHIAQLRCMPCLEIHCSLNFYLGALASNLFAKLWYCGVLIMSLFL